MAKRRMRSPPIALATPAPLVICPAMDREMWRAPSTQANLTPLRARGAVIVGPESGKLASGLAGPGRLAAIETIGAAVERGGDTPREHEGAATC